MRDGVLARGSVCATLRRQGETVFEHRGDNLVLDLGLQGLLQLLAGTPGWTPINVIACGVNAAWPAPPGQQQSLAVPAGATYIYTPQLTFNLSPAQPSGTAQGVWTATWLETQDNFTVWEVGLGATGPGGPYTFNRYVFPPPGINKTAQLELAVQYAITLTAS